jgi:hypothetical protein
MFYSIPPLKAEYQLAQRRGMGYGRNLPQYAAQYTASASTMCAKVLGYEPRLGRNKNLGLGLLKQNTL